MEYHNVATCRPSTLKYCLLSFRSPLKSTGTPKSLSDSHAIPPCEKLTPDRLNMEGKGRLEGQSLSNKSPEPGVSWLRGVLLRDIILGWQDGVVNVLGLVLGVATATESTRIILISGLAALFAESASMAAVAYTSSKAARDYYFRELRREQREIDETPESEIQEIRTIYYRKGFRDEELENIVRKITSDKRLWVETMMAEELRLFPEEYQNPVKSSGIVGFASVVGSFIPLMPFVFLSPGTGTIVSVGVSVGVLFGTGVVKAKVTIGDWLKTGVEMALVGTAAALFGYVIGSVLGAYIPA